VDIEPIHFVFEEGWLYCRTAPGTKITVLSHHPWVAFEIDDVRGPFDWRSVVVKGTVYFVEPDGSPALDEAYEHTLAVIRRLMPLALTDADPAPARTVLFRVHIDELHGRAAESAPAGR
jgi:nitroimidazol reductase NimA-like FMN-containing flavoprotein (pyridoxamine 5'-phosphate oxidase superfamily)